MSSKPKANGKSTMPSDLAAVPHQPGSQKASPRAGIPVPPEKRCTFLTRRGSPCRAARRNGSQFCIYHDPDFQRRRLDFKFAAHFVNLGEKSGTPEGIHEILRRNIEAVAGGKISPRISNSISYAAQLMMLNVKALENNRSTFEFQQNLEYENARSFVSDQLDKIEKEIQEAAEQASPVKVARAHRDFLRDAAQQIHIANPAEQTAADPAVAHAPPATDSRQSAADFGPPPPWAAELEEIAAGRKPYDPNTPADPVKGKVGTEQSQGRSRTKAN